MKKYDVFKSKHISCSICKDDMIVSHTSKSGICWRCTAKMVPFDESVSNKKNVVKKIKSHKLTWDQRHQLELKKQKKLLEHYNNKKKVNDD